VEEVEEQPRFRPLEPGDSSPFAPRAMQGRAPAAEPPADSRDPSPAAQPWRQAGDARLVAMQMAIAGSTRGEVHDHLAAVLGVVDSDPVLDGIFGPNRSPDLRLPGTGGRR
jgi:hypothetical protein